MFLLSIFVKKIIFFLVALKTLVPEYIHDDVIKHQTTWHETSGIIITEILLFQWINNRATFQVNSFDGGNYAIPNGENVFLWIFDIDWRQPSNLEKHSIMDVQCDVNPYSSWNCFFICKSFPIIWEHWSEHYSYYLKIYGGHISHIY